MGMIMGFSVGVTALHSLVCASEQAMVMFVSNPRSYLLNAMHHSGMELQLQKIFCTIISFREYYKYDKDNFPAYAEARLKDNSVNLNLHLHLTRPSQLIQMLRQSTELYDSVEEAQISFVRVQGQELRSKIKDHAVKDGLAQGHRLFPFNTGVISPSPTELLRIRRGLWRLRLYYEMYYEPFLPLAIRERQIKDHMSTKSDIKVKNTKLTLWGLSKEGKTNHINAQKEFFYRMTIWEIEELDCVWFHLNRQNNILWRRTCPYCRQNALPDHLIAHIRVCKYPQAVVDYRYDQSVPHYQRASSWFRLDHEEGFAGESDFTRWPTGLAREPSEGFKYLTKHHGQIEPNDPPPTIGRGAWREFCRWGYAIWDEETLGKYGLIDTAEGAAKLHWWRSR